MSRIDSVDVYILKAPLGKAKFWSSQSSFPERNSLLGAFWMSSFILFLFLFSSFLIFPFFPLSEDHQRWSIRLGRGWSVRSSGACGLRYQGITILLRTREWHLWPLPLLLLAGCAGQEDNRGGGPAQRHQWPALLLLQGLWPAGHICGGHLG